MLAHDDACGAWVLVHITENGNASRLVEFHPAHQLWKLYFRETNGTQETLWLDAKRWQLPETHLHPFHLDKMQSNTDDCCGGSGGSDASNRNTLATRVYLLLAARLVLAYTARDQLDEVMRESDHYRKRERHLRRNNVEKGARSRIPETVSVYQSQQHREQETQAQWNRQRHDEHQRTASLIETIRLVSSHSETSPSISVTPQQVETATSKRLVGVKNKPIPSLFRGRTAFTVLDNRYATPIYLAHGFSGDPYNASTTELGSTAGGGGNGTSHNNGHKAKPSGTARGRKGKNNEEEYESLQRELAQTLTGLEQVRREREASAKGGMAEATPVLPMLATLQIGDKTASPASREQMARARLDGDGNLRSPEEAPLSRHIHHHVHEMRRLLTAFIQSHYGIAEAIANPSSRSEKEAAQRGAAGEKNTGMRLFVALRDYAVPYTYHPTHARLATWETWALPEEKQGCFETDLLAVTDTPDLFVLDRMLAASQHDSEGWHKWMMHYHASPAVWKARGHGSLLQGKGIGSQHGVKPSFPPPPPVDDKHTFFWSALSVVDRLEDVKLQCAPWIRGVQSVRALFLAHLHSHGFNVLPDEARVLHHYVLLGRDHESAPVLARTVACLAQADAVLQDGIMSSLHPTTERSSPLLCDPVFTRLAEEAHELGRQMSNWAAILRLRHHTLIRMSPEEHDGHDVAVLQQLLAQGEWRRAGQVHALLSDPARAMRKVPWEWQDHQQQQGQRQEDEDEDEDEDEKHVGSGWRFKSDGRRAASREAQAAAWRSENGILSIAEDELFRSAETREVALALPTTTRTLAYLQRMHYAAQVALTRFLPFGIWVRRHPDQLSDQRMPALLLGDSPAYAMEGAAAHWGETVQMMLHTLSFWHKTAHGPGSGSSAAGGAGVSGVAGVGGGAGAGTAGGGDTQNTALAGILPELLWVRHVLDKVLPFRSHGRGLGNTLLNLIERSHNKPLQRFVHDASRSMLMGLAPPRYTAPTAVLFEHERRPPPYQRQQWYQQREEEDVTVACLAHFAFLERSSVDRQCEDPGVAHRRHWLSAVHGPCVWQDLRHEHAVSAVAVRPNFETLVEVQLRVLDWPSHLLGMLAVPRTKFNIYMLREFLCGTIAEQPTLREAQEHRWTLFEHVTAANARRIRETLVHLTREGTWPDLQHFNLRTPAEQKARSQAQLSGGQTRPLKNRGDLSTVRATSLWNQVPAWTNALRKRMGFLDAQCKVLVRQFPNLPFMSDLYHQLRRNRIGLRVIAMTTREQIGLVREQLRAAQVDPSRKPHLLTHCYEFLYPATFLAVMLNYRPHNRLGDRDRNTSISTNTISNSGRNESSSYPPSSSSSSSSSSCRPPLEAYLPSLIDLQERCGVKQLTVFYDALVGAVADVRAGRPPPEEGPHDYDTPSSHHAILVICGQLEANRDKVLDYESKLASTTIANATRKKYRNKLLMHQQRVQLLRASLNLLLAYLLNRPYDEALHSAAAVLAFLSPNVPSNPGTNNKDAIVTTTAAAPADDDDLLPPPKAAPRTVAPPFWMDEGVVSVSELAAYLQHEYAEKTSTADQEAYLRAYMVHYERLVNRYSFSLPIHLKRRIWQFLIGASDDNDTGNNKKKQEEEHKNNDKKLTPSAFVHLVLADDELAPSDQDHQYAINLRVFRGLYDLYRRNESKKKFDQMLGNLDIYALNTLAFVAHCHRVLKGVVRNPVSADMAHEAEAAMRRRFHLLPDMPLPEHAYLGFYTLCCHRLSSLTDPESYGHKQLSLHWSHDLITCDTKPARKRDNQARVLSNDPGEEVATPISSSIASATKSPCKQEKKKKKDQDCRPKAKKRTRVARDAEAVVLPEDAFSALFERGRDELRDEDELIESLAEGRDDASHSALATLLESVAEDEEEEDEAQEEESKMGEKEEKNRKKQETSDDKDKIAHTMESILSTTFGKTRNASEGMVMTPLTWQRRVLRGRKLLTTPDKTLRSIARKRLLKEEQFECTKRPPVIPLSLHGQQLTLIQGDHRRTQYQHCPHCGNVVVHEDANWSYLGYRCAHCRAEAAPPLLMQRRCHYCNKMASRTEVTIDCEDTAHPVKRLPWCETHIPRRPYHAHHAHIASLQEQAKRNRLIAITGRKPARQVRPGPYVGGVSRYAARALKDQETNTLVQVNRRAHIGNRFQARKSVKGRRYKRQGY